MSYITHLGGAVVSITLCLILVAINPAGNKLVGWESLLVLSSSHVIVHVLKRVSNRPRPYRVIEEITNYIIPVEGYSFPSGHSTAAFSLALVLSFHFPAFSLLFTTLATIVSVSRIYLGVHYPSDVFFGILIAIVFSFGTHHFIIL
ncbi:phosphatase PAP2 family protein [Halothermothrix orenii]|nr:phosphatase PAP2 family protein [Halothermothrix orenii]